MFNKAPGIGLDIGSKKIKLARVKKVNNGLQVVKYGSLITPLGTVEAGNIFEPERVGEALGELVADLNLKGKSVISAVSGTQVYTRNLIMPRMKLEELKQTVTFEASTFLPIPIEEAAMDIFPLRNFEDEEGKKTEIFFVAVRRQQVENLQIVCQIAGLKLAAVEIEPLAVNRLLKEGNDYGVRAYLHIGASRSYYSVFREQVLIYHRYLSFGCSAFFEGKNPDNNDEMIETINIKGDEQYNFLVRDIIAEVSRSIEYYTMQNEDKIEKILICGGGSRLHGLDEAIAANVNYPVETADNLPLLTLPGGINDRDNIELKHEFTVALGLAARGVI